MISHSVGTYDFYSVPLLGPCDAKMFVKPSVSHNYLASLKCSTLHGSACDAPHCRPFRYDRSRPYWALLFGRIADDVIQLFRPRRVFDVTCTHCFLVETLWRPRVEACGRDISEFSISGSAVTFVCVYRSASLSRRLKDDLTLSSEVGQLRARVAYLEAQIAERDRAAILLAAARSEAIADVAHHRAELDAILQSTSWRLVSALQSISRFFPAHVRQGARPRLGPPSEFLTFR